MINTNVFFDVTDFQVQSEIRVLNDGRLVKNQDEDTPVGYVKSCTCWWYSLYNFQYRSSYENTCSYNFECCMSTSMYFYIFDVYIQGRV